MAIGGGRGPGHFFSFSIYDRASHWEPNTFYGIEKARRGVEIRHFECRQNGRFSQLSKISNAISEKSLEWK